MDGKRLRRLAWVGAPALAALALGGLVAVAAPASAAGSNLLVNGDFQSGTLSGWTCDAGTASVVSSPVYSGSSYALAATPTGQDDAQCAQTVSVAANSSYTLTAQVQGSYVYLGVSGAASTSTWTPSATSWQQLSVTFSTGASAGTVTVYLHGWYAQPEYYADDVSLVGPPGGGGSTPPTTPPTTTPTTPPTTPPTTTPPVTTPPVTTPPPGNPGPEPGFGPYVDITRGTPLLQDVAQATGQKYFTLAFVLGDSTGCNPSWGGTIALNDPSILSQISALRAMGGDVAVSFGGAEGPYLNQTCTSTAQLTGAIEQVITTLNVTHLDFDVEASVPLDTMMQAIAQVQKDYPATTVRFTLEVQADTYGLTPALGVQLLQTAVADGVKVGIVNPMLMDFSSSGEEWGQAVITAAQAVEGQMATIWPNLTTSQLYAMLGGTVMIGDNDTGPVFSLADASTFISWANSNHIGFVSFWSVGRDNGSCPGGGVSPACSGIAQSTYQFTSIFRGFTG